MSVRAEAESALEREFSLSVKMDPRLRGDDRIFIIFRVTALEAFDVWS